MTYRYRLFIDDERMPTEPDWFVARNSYQAICALVMYGMPYEIAFDHDLGGQDTSMVFINKLVDFLNDGAVEFPEDFKYSVHSQNPIGAENIRCYMNNIIKEYK